MVDPKPLVTILIPTYNRQEYLVEAIDSVLDQDYEPLDVLVLDDGSTDDTPAILEDYANRHPDRLRFVRHDNMGEARTTNRGFELARGELVGRFCDDDRALPGAVGKLAGALTADPAAVGAYGAWHHIDERGEIIDTYYPIEYSIVDSLRLMDFIMGPGSLFRSSVIAEVGGYDPALKYCPDWDFTLRIASHGPLLRIREPLYEWRRHSRRGGGEEGRGADHAREYVELLERTLARKEVREQLEARPDFETIRAQAYRSAYILAAWASGPGMNASPEERFYVADRHWRGNLEREASDGDLEAQIADLRAETWSLIDRISERDRHIRQQDEHIREVEGARDALAEYMERPRWWRLARELLPDPLRARLKSLMRRRSPG
jgi:glycosyltransferase involved in cell wall biosynthesis